jgi:hypothetical protein
MTLATTLVLSLLLNMQLLSGAFNARAWESTYISALDHPEPDVRAHAARELGGASSVSGRGLEAVAARLADPDMKVRIAAAEGLGAAGRAAKPYLTTLRKVQKEHENPQTRTAAAAAEKAISNAPLIQIGGGFLKFLAVLLGLGILAAVWFRDHDVVRGTLARLQKRRKPA